jgi:hypothetical protein
MFRRWWNNPRTALKVTISLIITGGLIAGLGTFLRDRSSDQNDQWTFLLDTFGLLVAIIGAVLDFRASARVAEFVPGAGRLRAMTQLLVGVFGSLGACILLGWVKGTTFPPIVRGLTAAGMTAAIGAGLAGMLFIGWFSGANHLERRIEQRIDEEW